MKKVKAIAEIWAEDFFYRDWELVTSQRPRTFDTEEDIEEKASLTLYWFMVNDKKIKYRDKACLITPEDCENFLHGLDKGIYLPWAKGHFDGEEYVVGWLGEMTVSAIMIGKVEEDDDKEL